MDFQIINLLDSVIRVENFDFYIIVSHDVPRLTHILGGIVDLKLVLFSANLTDCSKELDFNWHCVE